MPINPFLNVPDQGDDDPRYSYYDDSDYFDEDFDVDGIGEAADKFALAVYSVSEDFWDSYDITGGDEPEILANEMHKLTGTKPITIPDFVEGRTDKEYAQDIYDAAKELYDALYNNIDCEHYFEEYNLNIWMEICEETMNKMNAILAS